VKYGLLTVACLALLGIAVYKHYGFQLDEQTGLDPQNMEEVNERNDQVNQWAKPEVMNVPMSAKSKSTVAKDLSNAVRTNIVGIVSDKNKITLGFYIMSNFLIVPNILSITMKGILKSPATKLPKPLHSMLEVISATKYQDQLHMISRIQILRCVLLPQVEFLVMFAIFSLNRLNYQQLLLYS
jgi:hypothetical protein